MITPEVLATLLDPDVDEETNLQGIQQLIDSGAAWQLEGSVGRACMAAIEDGFAVLGPEGHRDFWGSYVPGRGEVEPGSKGSIEYGHKVGGSDAGHSFEGGCPKCDALRGTPLI